MLGDNTVAEQKAQQISGHGSRRGGVMDIAGRRTIELGFVVVEARNGVACPTPERGQRRGAADSRQQRVRTGVVAEFDHRLAHVGNRHRAFLGPLRKVLFCDRRVIEEIARLVRDHVGKMILAVIDPRQHEGGQRGLEGAAHDEALVGAPGDLRTGGKIFGVNADPPAGVALIGGQRGRSIFRQRRRNHQA